MMTFEELEVMIAATIQRSNDVGAVLAGLKAERESRLLPVHTWLCKRFDTGVNPAGYQVTPHNESRCRRMEATVIDHGLERDLKGLRRVLLDTQLRQRGEGGVYGWIEGIYIDYLGPTFVRTDHEAPRMLEEWRRCTALPAAWAIWRDRAELLVLLEEATK